MPDLFKSSHDERKGDRTMETLQVPEARKLAAAYSSGRITLAEFMEKLEWCWDMKIYRGGKAPVVEREGVLMPPILTQDR
jgi:hypothetical protein